MVYRHRLLDGQLDALFPELAAVAIEGAKGVGKTATALRRAKSVVALDHSGQLAALRGDVNALLDHERPLLIDEWQMLPEVWDVVRRAVDQERLGGQFLLTGSAWPAKDIRIHSGAGRIVRLHMRPMALCERQVSTPTISLNAILVGRRLSPRDECPLGLRDYVREILASGLPGLRGLSTRAMAIELRSYLDRALDHDLPEAGHQVRRPQALRSWLAAYAAATSSTVSYNKILDAATAGESEKPARQTVAGYREALERMWFLDPLPAWWPARSPLKRLGQAPKHHLADPALAAVLLNATEGSLLRGEGDTLAATDGALLGALFESLAVLSVRSMAAAMEFETFHLRTKNGDHEVDLIVEGSDGRVLAIEVKMTDAVASHDVGHLNWLQDRLGDKLIDRVVLTSGKQAYRRQDGVLVVPLGLLGP